MSTLGWLFIVAGLLIGAFAFWVLSRILRDRHEDRAAAFEFRATGRARPFRVVLPYLADGSYHRAAPRVTRSGPLYPADLPGPVLSSPVFGGGRAGEPDVPLPDALPVLSGRRPEAVPALTPPPATYPEWVQRLLDGDLDAAIAADIAWCERMAVAA